ncbi:hypothetical protein K435DRAFT_789851 [Dendrothele bispora CBS 962.96]|uniref:Uncharacterized protein n=1 Tax=Dendrothele bispora (strain CBS 962.96) TaxID=1314807 RepID=A0A4S8MRS5_DENBC|nr:hypothetical protein K435DRAFT_789851 [Dendrothele bispora CBS 962.96]
MHLRQMLRLRLKEAFGFVDDQFFIESIVTSVTSNMPDDWNYGTAPPGPNISEMSEIVGLGAPVEIPDWTFKDRGQRLYYGEHYPRLERLKVIPDPSDAFGFPTAIALRTQYVCLRSFLDKKIHARSYIEGDNINNKVDGNWICAGGSVATTAFYGGLTTAHRFHACKLAL